ncbi:MAG: hypothetical protein A4E53_00366 [Pelotomaculum sp. PtaB.Bin104]|nr:MAG: hypothetical protein A4E53_00366 [Pelotomaculum sp. PtaB.Bin104]
MEYFFSTQTGGMILKKILIGILIGAILTIAAMAFGDEKPIKILLDGKEVYSDVPPQIIDNRTFVPIRVISEALGVDVKWDSATRSVILTSPENVPIFSVVSYNKVDTEYGYAIFGEVKNRSTKTFSKVEVKADVLDSGGKVVETLSTQLPPGVTSGETAYFRLRSFSGKGNLFYSVKFNFITSDECSVTPTDVVFSNIRFTGDPNTYNDFIYATGEIDRTDKDYTRVYKNPMVQIALFDQDGKMVNYGEKFLSDYDLHRYGEFKITLDNGPAYSTYKLKCFSD